MKGTTFANANSPSPFLYISTETAEGWCAFLMDDSEDFSDAEISFKTLWEGGGKYKTIKYSGEFLFARKEPASLSEANLNALRNAVKEKVEGHYNKSLVWLLEPDLDLPAENLFVVPMFEESLDNFEITQEASLSWGGIGQLNFVKNAVAHMEISGDYSAIRFPIPTGTPPLRPLEFAMAIDGGEFDMTRHSLQIPMDSFLSIPLSGDSRGCIRFEMELFEDTDLGNFDLGQKFFYSKDGNGQTAEFSFPFFRALRENRLVKFQVSIDPTNLQNLNMTDGGLDPARTYLAFAGTTRNDLRDDDPAEETIFESWYRTHNGYRIKLRPNTAGTASDAEANTLFADRQTARLVWNEKKAGSNEWYFSPAGEFFMVLEEEDVDKAVVNGQAHLLAGLSGTETIGFQPTTQSGDGDRLYFQPYRPAFAPVFPVTGNDNGSDATAPLLTAEAQTSWANVVASNDKKVTFSAEPEGASLYSKEHGINAISSNGDDLLGFFELVVAMPQYVDFCMPIVPYEGIQLPEGTPVEEGLEAFESQVISTTRKTEVSAKAPPSIFAEGEPEIITSTTPQGAIAKVKPEDGSWEEVLLAQNTVNEVPTTSNYLNYAGAEAETAPPEFKVNFINLGEALKDAFQTNQQFLVATQNENLGALFTKMTEPEQQAGSSDDAVFNNQMYIREWPFFINTGRNGGVGDYRNVLIFKFCKGSLKERLKDPVIWTKPGDFNTPDELPEIATWAQNYIAEAATQDTSYFAHFNSIVNDPYWNGILALKLDLPKEDFPDELKGLLAGVNDPDGLTMHHFGIEINHVETAGGIKIEENSSLFGLFSYFDPVYKQGILDGAHPDMPIQPASETFDFKVLTLQVLFQNTDIKDFASKVQVKLGKLLQDDVRLVTIQDVGDTDTQSLILNGTYEERDGVKSYIFEQSKSNKFHLDSNILHFMEIERASFDTVSTEGDTVQSRFSFLGNINFEILKGKDDDGNETQLDLFSFGSEEGEEGFDIGKGLHFSNLHLDMTFPLDNPKNRDFDMVVKYFKLGIENSYSRKDGLFTQLPLGFQNFIFGTGAKLPTGYGFEPIMTPAIETTGFSGEWLGLKYKINLGTPGMLASTGAFDAELLLAWSPQGKEDDETYRLYLGILLPGASGNSKAISLQGILGLNVDTVTLNFDKKPEDETGAYILSLDDISLRFFNFKMVPPIVPPGIEQPQANAYLFANRKEGEAKKNIGWLMAYKGPDTSEFTGVTIPFIALGQHVALSSTENINSVSDAIEAMKSAFFPAASDESDFGYEIVYNFEFGDSIDDGGSEDDVSLVFSDESSWLIAFEFGLLAKVPKKDKKNGSSSSSGGSSGQTSGGESDDEQSGDNGDKEEEEEFDDFAVELAVVFNDPEIYGLRLGLGGEAMKVFDGLEFEILYKKVTDSVGVYKILFTLPDHFRSFEVGAAKLTLPVLGLDIYTNGDFKVDLGFPYDLDFSRSFAIEVQAGPFPLVGSAGFYFGKLSGETALMLPDVAKVDGKEVGRFDTVIIFGFGFEIGFGKSIEKGVLSASFKITLVAVVEGVVAPFVPDATLFPAQASSGNVEETNYYWVQGTIGLVGILQGEVDFVVISASVYVRVYALIEATFEAYRPVPIVLKAGVTVQASVKILFVKVKFSFSATISAKITVGEDRWHLAPWNTLPSSSRMAFAAMQARDAALQIIGFEVTATDFSGTKNDLSLLFSLQPTISDTTGKVSYVALLMMDSNEFKQLSDDVFTWVVKSYRKTTGAAANADLSLTELESIKDCLNNAGPSRSEIESFLTHYYNLSIVGLEAEADLESTIFPMIPALQMDWTGNATPVDFATKNQVDGDYLGKVKEFLKDLSLNVEGLESDATEASLATHIFEDYFHLMAKHLVDEAIESFENFSYELNRSTKLSDIETAFGVSIADIAEQNKLHPLKDSSTFHDLSVSTGKTIAELAEEKKDVEGLFDHEADLYLGVKGIAELSISNLLDDLERNNVSSNLAGMVARYQLSGLRLPKIGVTQVDTSTEHSSLFHLTGQQFALPDSVSGNFDITITRADADTWLKVGSGKSLTISQLAADVNGLRNGFVDAGIPFVTPAPVRLPSFETVEKRFNFKRFSEWNTSSLIWHFPDTLTSHLYTSNGENLNLRYGVFNEAKQRLEYFDKAAEWGTLVEVTIKRKPGQDETNLRYELIGTDEIGITLLERLLLSDEEILGGNIQVLYDDGSATSGDDTPETFGGDKKSLQSLDISAINTFITQANLSTETNPIETGGRMAMMIRGVAVPHGILNEPEEFVRLIWECSIVRSGGYYLFYQDLAAADPKGLPDAIFDGDGVAKLSILVKSNSGKPANFSNCAITDSSIDAANSMVFAEDATQTHSVALLPQSVVSYELLRDVPGDPAKPTPPVLPDNPTAEQQAQYTAALAVYNDELAKYYDDFLENIYQLLAFQVDGESGGFNESLMSVPVGPANDVGKDEIDEHDRKSQPSDTAAEWRYKLAVPLSRHATEFGNVSTFHGEPNPYAGIGQDAKLKMTWRDLYGNQALDNSLTQSIGNLGFTDELLSIAKWPNVTANYEFDKVDDDNFKLNIHLRYTAPDFGVNNQVSDDAQQAARDNRIAEAKQKFAKIYYQLNRLEEGGLSVVSSFFKPEANGEMGSKSLTFSDLIEFFNEVYTQLDIGEPGSVEKTLTIEFTEGEINPASIFELEVGVKFQRDVNHVDDDFKASPNVASTIGMVQPILGIDKANSELTQDDTNPTQDKPLAVFAQDFEEAFAKENIKIATGINKEDLNTTQRRQDVWVVKMDDLASEIGDSPLYLAVKPLSTKLTTGKVDVYDYATNEGLKFDTENLQSFSDIDLDVWAQQFLEAVDDFLSPEQSTSAFLVDKILNTNYLGEIVADKRTLADKIVSGLTPVWEDAGTPSTDQMDAAREKLKQQLLIKLRQAYLVNTVVQFGVSTDGGFSLEDKPVRLYGKPVIVKGDGAGSGDRNFSFSNAKVQLDAQDAFLTFLFDTKQDEAKATVEFNLNYKITHLEYRIEDSAQMEGYEISSWLMFVNPVDASDASSPLVKPLGHLKIPVVLRNFPTPPTLVRQFGEQSKEEDDKSALANATQWDYGLTYTQRAAAQDTLKAGVTLNCVPDDATFSSRAMLGGRSFFEELATFITLYPDIQADLANTLPTIHANTPADDGNLATASKALDALRQLVDAVTLAWPQYDASGMAMASRSLDTMKLNVRFDFEIQEYSRDGSNEGDFLAEVTPGEISHPVELDTPVIRMAGFANELDSEESTAEKNVYKYAGLDWQTAKGIAERTAVLENLSILEWQNAVSEVSITRNEDLLEGKTTRSEFIYTTPVVKFPNKIVPLLDNIQPVNIAEIGTGERVVRTLAEHLQIFFKELMDRELAEDNQLVKLECLYAYQLRDGGKLPDVKLPVLLVPPYDFQLPTDWDLEDENSFVNQLAKGITIWFNEHLPSDDNVFERFLLDVSIFSKLTASKLPVLRLRNVFLGVDDVSDLQA